MVSRLSNRFSDINRKTHEALNKRKHTRGKDKEQQKPQQPREANGKGREERKETVLQKNSSSTNSAGMP